MVNAHALSIKNVNLIYLRYKIHIYTPLRGDQARMKNRQVTGKVFREHSHIIICYVNGMDILFFGQVKIQVCNSFVLPLNR
jgi:hypothetical protein